jgi:enhancing lycopene biosynthesis protein 2
MNCLTGEESAGESRNQLIESARIARGKVQALSTLRPEEFDGLMIPGGYGVAKNLCTFAFKGSQGTVNSEIEKIVKKFYALKKPIGAICIAPALVGLVLKGQNIELTLGPSGEASQEIEKLGHKHIIKSAKEWHVDRAHKILSTPAYMIDDSPLADIFEGIAGMTKELVKMC